MINLNRLQELKDFILDKDSEGAIKQLEICNDCNINDQSSTNCKIKDYCSRYTPLDYNEQTINLINDLFETIDVLVDGLCSGCKESRVKDNNVIELIEEIIMKIKQEYPDLNLSWQYDLTENSYEINHDGLDLELHNEKFAIFVGTLIKNVLYDNGVYNVWINADYDKSRIKICE